MAKNESEKQKEQEAALQKLEKDFKKVNKSNADAEKKVADILKQIKKDSA
jgi:hypothetical protein